MMSEEYPSIDPDRLSEEGLKRIIDFTLLRPEANREQYAGFLETAVRYGFGSVFIPPCYVSWAVKNFAGEGLKVGTPIAFPFGYTSRAVKAEEAVRSLEEGAQELDVVMNISFALSGMWEEAEEDLRHLVEAVRDWERQKGEGKIVIKTILETPYLSPEDIVRACRCAENAGIDLVKTATGLGAGGATVEAVKIMKESVGNRLGVKASGGIRSWEDVRIMLLAGAVRIGTSTGPQILEEFTRARDKGEGQ